MFDSRTAGLPLNSDWMKDAMDMMSSGCFVDVRMGARVRDRASRRGVECGRLLLRGSFPTRIIFESAFDAATRLGSARLGSAGRRRRAAEPVEREFQQSRARRTPLDRPPVTARFVRMDGNSTESVGGNQRIDIDIDIDALAERLRELAPDQDALEEAREAQERACVDLVLAADAVKSFLKFDATHAEQIKRDLRRAAELAKAIAEETHAASASIARAKRVLIEANVIGEDALRAFDPDAKRKDYY